MSERYTRFIIDRLARNGVIAREQSIEDRFNDAQKLMMDYTLEENEFEIRLRAPNFEGLHFGFSKSWFEG